MPIAATISRSGVRRLFFFLLAGGTGFVLYLGISNALHYLLKVDEVTSAVVGTILPVLPTFWMQRNLTFNSERPKHQALPRYAILQLGNAALIGGMTAVGADLGMPGAIVFLVAGALGTLISYGVQAKLVFPAR